MEKYWCYTHIMSIFCLWFWIMSRDFSAWLSVCTIYISKLLLLPFSLHFNLLVFLQQLDSRQDHPTSWTASRQQRYISVLIYVHYPGTSINYCSRPKPNVPIPKPQFMRTVMPLQCLTKPWRKKYPYQRPTWQRCLHWHHLKLCSNMVSQWIQSRWWQCPWL